MKNTIQFMSSNPSVEVLRLSKDGIWANPDIPADDAAKLVLAAIENHIKFLVQKVVEDEREACAAIARQWDVDHPTTNYGGCIANEIIARGQA